MRQCICAKIALFLTKLEFPIMIYKARGKGKAAFCAPWRHVRSRGMASLVLNLDTRWICADSCRPRPPYCEVRTHDTHWLGGLVGSSPSWRSGDEKNPLSLPGIETRFPGCPTRRLTNTECAISAPFFFMLSHIYETMFLTAKQRAAAMSISILLYSAQYQYRCVSE
jgi:hypothetical protein